MLNYLEIINQNIKPGTRTSKIYLVHAVLVTNKALKIAHKLNLNSEQRTFIEEAAMLHDIGVIKVNSPKMDCTGDLPYICHGIAGAEILRTAGLENQALVAERHVGVGLTKTEIVNRGLPLPHQDYVPLSLEEQIITYADLFFSKREETLWTEDSPSEIVAELAGYGPEQVKIFQDWKAIFD